MNKLITDCYWKQVVEKDYAGPITIDQKAVLDDRDHLIGSVNLKMMFTGMLMLLFGLSGTEDRENNLGKESESVFLISHREHEFFLFCWFANNSPFDML